MINEALVSARKEKGWTQDDVAQKLGCQKSTVSNWERGYSKPPLEDAFRVADLYGRTVESLFRHLLVQESQTTIAR
ncbi:helix-turn-helix transcriptional regulator [Cohnella sp. GCM10020058]|uniref:helix-turn-helix transcriptional regulator n=1 Tax=Cohnella sp. GCM10020058 TaxID=3317330 RepID=UPI0036416A0D